MKHMTALLSTIWLALSLGGLHAAQTNGYKETDLVSDQPNIAKFTDPNLINPWGFLFSNGTLVVADNGTGMATTYNPAGHPTRLRIKVPAPGGLVGKPTGVVKNPGSDGFFISSGKRSRPSTYLFVTEDGTIGGWNSRIDPTNVIITVDNSLAGAVYKGVTAAKTSHGPRLYAADFGRGVVEVYDRNFLLLKSFPDSELMASNYAPFGIQTFGPRLYVAFALKASETGGGELSGPGTGYIDEFDLEGNLVRRFASEGSLNTPYGMAVAPRGFGKFSGALLVGNYGDGTISAYHPGTGAFWGQLTNLQGKLVQIPCLWTLGFPDGRTGNALLYFTAAPEEEQHGLLGVLSAVGRGRF